MPPDASKVWLYGLLMLPPTSDVVVTVSGAVLTVMLRLAVVLTGVGVCESVTCTVKFEVPSGPVGVPEITPALLKLNPAGKLPAVTLHVYDGTPPLACSVWLYTTPSAAPGNVVVVTTSAAGGPTVIVMARLAETAVASMTWKVTDPLLTPVGMPLITPVLLFKFNPAGNAPELMVQWRGLVPPDSPIVAT